jgi:cis-3-alkyl-4-acyloxetan-2-one decarboxylase
MTLRLKPLIDGPESAETIVFIQGWPDDASLWNEQVKELAPRYRCVRVDLPNAGNGPRARWGYSTEEIIEALAECIRESSPDAPVTLVIHDWGAYWGHMLHHRYPELVQRVAGLDIAPHFKPGAGAALGIVAYQGWLLAAFVAGGPVGDWMTRSLARRAGAPGDAKRIRASMNYPYRNVWQDFASGRARRSTEGYWPKVPLLFVYGKKKPFPFHSKRWVDHVRRVGGEVVALECGHWVSQAPEFNTVLTKWLERTASAAG